jgi:hypothetical protein
VTPAEENEMNTENLKHYVAPVDRQRFAEYSSKYEYLVEPAGDGGKRVRAIRIAVGRDYTGPASRHYDLGSVEFTAEEVGKILQNPDLRGWNSFFTGRQDFSATVVDALMSAVRAEAR